MFGDCNTLFLRLGFLPFIMLICVLVEIVKIIRQTTKNKISLSLDKIQERFNDKNEENKFHQNHCAYKNMPYI